MNTDEDLTAKSSPKLFHEEEFVLEVGNDREEEPEPSPPELVHDVMVTEEQPSARSKLVYSRPPKLLLSGRYYISFEDPGEIADILGCKQEGILNLTIRLLCSTV